MRYYDIFVYDDTGPLGQVAVRRWTSFVNGQTVPGAQNIELDCPVYNYAPAGNLGAVFVKIWGISLQDVSQASDLNGLKVKLYAGMQKGLPLANPKQAGLIMQGEIQQCFGNWEGTEQYLSMVIVYGGDLGSPDAPQNIVLNWPAGMTLGDAAAQALRVAFPALTVTVSADKRLVQNYDSAGFYQSLQQFAGWLVEASQKILGTDYGGLQVSIRGTTLVVYDATATIGGVSFDSPKLINFIDLIGQPTWFNFAQVSFKCVMRSDLQPGDFIRMPPAQYTTQSQSFSQYRNKSAFQGVFIITQLRHLGNFRQRDAGSWVTTIQAAFVDNVDQPISALT